MPITLDESSEPSQGPSNQRSEEPFRPIFWPSWSLINDLSLALGEALTSRWPMPEGIVAVSRGGLVPAAIIANRYNIRRVQVACLGSYSAEDKRGRIYQLVEIPFLNGMGVQGGLGWWIIDDIIDSGQTFTYLQTRWPGAVYGALYNKLQSAEAFTVNMPVCVKLIDKGTWVRFPWEPPS